MTKQLMKRLAVSSALVAAITPLIASATPLDIGTVYGENIGLGTNTDIKTVIVNIIRLVLGFLGLIAVIIVLYGGFQWMTASGNEEKVSSARATLTAGLIGLVIILAAYAISAYVITIILEQTA